MKKTTLIIVSLLAIVVIAAASVLILKVVGDQKNQTTVDQLTGSRSEANQIKVEADKAANAGQNQKAVDLYKQALEKNKAVDAQSGEYTDTAPSPEVVDIQTQLDLLETVEPPKGEAQQAPNTFPETEASPAPVM